MYLYIPIVKSGGKEIVNNYRPIFTLPFFSKFFEKLMHERLQDYYTLLKPTSCIQTNLVFNQVAQHLWRCWTYMTKYLKLLIMMNFPLESSSILQKLLIPYITRFFSRS